MYVINREGQRGIGMTEVLVALLLLAVGVLGFTALQMRAISATTESVNRTQALLVMRGLAERMRANKTDPTTLAAYKTGLSQTSAPTNSCTGTKVCTPAELATLDAYEGRVAALANGVMLGMAACPGEAGSKSWADRQCLIAAWDGTAPVIDTTDATTGSSCMNSAGIYHRRANCIVMEVY
ncbi:MAG: type IV pilus modification protein PilV [Pseudomonadota bacterium]|nr:type IV pilus modification protein PilV [Pseudomonadota bacterium]